MIKCSGNCICCEKRPMCYKIQSQNTLITNKSVFESTFIDKVSQPSKDVVVIRPIT